ncbi:oligopeptide/dipeptide ABC transporter ATP-binding protein [Fodinicurvata halophila]|uniref:oligopeptide/dipeptide ABC transporter ATP-binding protein n=1 Tax=Fodinicurvata halophila TaxID=1419723 RepID=UPI0036379E36
MQRELNLTILIITHNLNVVRHISDRMAIMYLGRFVETGPTQRIFDRPRHPYTEALLSANPTPDPESRSARIVLSGEIPSLMNRPSGCEFHPRCPYARDLCAAQTPELAAEKVASGVRRYSCHFPLEEARPGSQAEELADPS